MELYRQRKIEFKELIDINDWKIKVYTISKNEKFNHPKFYKAVKKELKKWLFLDNSFNPSNDKVGFLILHSGNEGIFSLINWWIDKHMMNTHIFLTKLDEPISFARISGDGLAPCIWELEIINHERISWTKNILKKVPEPHINDYLNDTISLEV